MKNLITYSIFLLCAVTAFGQSPEKISYQAIVRDADGNLLKNTEISLKVSLIQGLDDDAMVYEEDHSTITNTNGLVSIEIGMGETANDFGNIDWSLGSYLLQTDIDPEVGTN
ncbi:MAG: hypothetical protein PF517_13135 [Salinivirgaceae bacterium]|jgi:hypothetical protein|nr:hypothetical protein [Salinivirgaceae bacterium]